MARVKKASVSIDGTQINYTFADGAGEVSLDAADLNNEMKSTGLMHGLKQKISDSFAGAPTPAEAMERASAVIDALVGGKWNVRVAGEGGTRVTQLARALAMVTGKELDEAVSVISDMTDEAKKNLTAHPEIKRAVAEIRAEEAQRAAAEAAEATDESAPSIADLLSQTDGEEEAAE